MNWLLQSWNESNNPEATIPKSIRLILKLACKMNVGFDALRISTKTKAKMPLWHHPAILNHYLWNKKASKCLRNHHEIKTVGDAIDFTAIRFKKPPCLTMPACLMMCERLLDELPNKFNPNMTTPHRDNLDHTPKRIKKERQRDKTKHPIVFDPSITAYGTPATHTRIFQKHKSYKTRRYIDEFILRRPANREMSPMKEGTMTTLKIYTDGLSTLNGADNSQAGAGIYVKGRKNLCQSVRIPGEQTNQRAELIAILLAIQQALNTPIKIYTDSHYCIDGITKLAKNKEDLDWLDTPHDNVWKAILYCQDV